MGTRCLWFGEYGQQRPFTRGSDVPIPEEQVEEALASPCSAGILDCVFENSRPEAGAAAMISF